MKSNNELWFKAKKYGWGWTPSTWEGWAVIGMYILCVIYEFFSIAFNSRSITDTLLSFIPSLIIFTLLLIAICFVKGEKPEWRWGDKKRN